MLQQIGYAVNWLHPSGDNNEKVYNVDGIITIDTTANVALLKVANSDQTGVILGDYKALTKEDPVFTISSKTGVGLSIQSGIIITTVKFSSKTLTQLT